MNERKLERPPLVTAICYFLIIRSAFFLAMFLAFLGDPVFQKKMQLPWLILLIVFSILLPLILAIFMLRGKNWARLGYFIFYGGGSVTLAVLVPNSTTIFSLVTGALFALPLLTHRAHRYFTGNRDDGVLEKKRTSRGAGEYQNEKSIVSPPLVSFACYAIIILGALKFAFLLSSLGNPAGDKKLDPFATITLPFILLGLALFFASFMLWGKNWARIGYLALYGGGIVWLQCINPGLASFVSAFFFIAFALLLITPRANCYFTGKDYHLEKQKASERRPAPKAASHQTRRRHRDDY